MKKSLLISIAVLLSVTCLQVMAIYGTQNVKQFKKDEQGKFATLKCEQVDMSGNPCANSKSSKACLCRKIDKEIECLNKHSVGPGCNGEINDARKACKAYSEAQTKPGEPAACVPTETSD